MININSKKLLSWLVLMLTTFISLSSCKNSDDTVDIVDTVRMNTKRISISNEVLRKTNVEQIDIRELNAIVDNYVVYDRISGSILEINRRGEIIDTLVYPGRGPLECTLPVNFKVQNGIVRFVDRDLRAYKVISNDTIMNDYYKLQSDISDALIVSPESFVISSTGPNLSLNLSLYLNRGKEWETIDFTPSEFEERGASISFDGFFASNDCGKLFFIPYLKSKLYIWNMEMFRDKMSIRDYDLIYDIPEPELLLTDNSAMALESTIHLIDVAATCDYIYVLNVISDSKDYLYIDVYSSHNANYIKSIKVSIKEEINRPRGLTVGHNNLLHVLYEYSIESYSLFDVK
jgi:hypothetical protein